MTGPNAVRPAVTAVDGFSLIEVLIAAGLLTTGVLALAGVLAIGLRHVSGSSPSLIAREKAREAVESVHTARDTGQLSWARIRNDDRWRRLRRRGPGTE